MTPDVGDADLLASLRGGDDEAYGVLYARHERAGRRFARRLVRDSATADEVVSEAFTRVLRAIRNGNGPDVAFRPYLFVAIRNVATNAIGERDKVDLTAELDEASDDADLMLEATDRSLIAQAYADLPERWRAILWHLEVADMSVSEVAPLMGMKPNAVSALAFRAREALRVAYLQAHLRSDAPAGCARIASDLGRFVRGSLPAAQSDRVDAHLATCGACQGAVTDLRDVATAFRAAAVPVLLGAAAHGGWSRARRRRTAQATAAAAVAVALLLAALVARDDGSRPVASSDPSTTAVAPPPTSVDGGSAPERPGEAPATTTTTAPPTSPPPSTTAPGPTDPARAADPGPGSPPSTAPGATGSTPPLTPVGAVRRVRPVGSPRRGAPSFVLVEVVARDGRPVDVQVAASGTTIAPASARGACGGTPLTCSVPVVDGVGELLVRTGPLSAAARVEVLVAGSAAPSSVLALDPTSTGIAPTWASDEGVAVAATGGHVGPRECGGPGSGAGALVLPPGALVRWARAYWTSRADPGPVSLRTPSGASIALSAQRADSVDGMVQRSADVRGLVGASGTYAITGAPGVAPGSWSLVVAYSAPSVPARSMAVVYDAMTRVVAPTRFGVAPAGGAASVGVIAHGGSADVVDDAVSAGSRHHPGVFDGTSQIAGRSVTTCGLDLEALDAAGSAELAVHPGGERLVVGVVWGVRSP